MIDVACKRSDNPAHCAVPLGALPASIIIFCLLHNLLTSYGLASSVGAAFQEPQRVKASCLSILHSGIPKKDASALQRLCSFLCLFHRVTASLMSPKLSLLGTVLAAGSFCGLGRPSGHSLLIIWRPSACLPPSSLLGVAAAHAVPS